VDERPLLLLDIDGVLDPWAATACPDGFEEHVLFPADEQPHRFARHHSRWIRDLDRRFEIAWASAWGMVANDLVGPILGLPTFAWVPYPEDPWPPESKVPSIAAFVGDRAVAWVDDVIGDDAHDWASGRAAPTLLVETDPAIGLTLDHLATLRRWQGG
jgi:hypothetical protein